MREDLIYFVQKNKQNIFKMFLLGFVSLSIFGGASEPFTNRLLHGLLVAIAFVVAQVLKKDRYSQIMSGIKWMKLFIYLGFAPMIFWFLMLFILGPDQVNSILSRFIYLGGPFIALQALLRVALFPISLKHFNLIFITLWWLLPLTVGFYVQNERRSKNENTT